MAKKPARDPVVESLSDAMSSLFSAVMLHSMEMGGPAAAIATVDSLVQMLVEQRGQLLELKNEKLAAEQKK